MAARKYPLDPLAKLREQHVDEASRELAAAARARETAEQRTRLAEREKDAAEESARAVREAERAKLEGGELTVADLQRADAWGVAVAEETKRLEERVARAITAESEARTGEAQHRTTVATRKADAGVVEKDRAKWTEQARKDALGREEEEAEEAWRPKH
jgi:YscO-like protein